ncbi:MAG: dihydrofolate reductase [Methylococcales bacterium]|nr:dihydrofolate reductase [Methylococcales bacterium]
MKISLIVAMSKNRVIGRDNKMPWHLSADLKRFRAITMNSPILMGRKTFESIGKPLDGRTNLILSKNANYQQQGCLVFQSLESALNEAKKYGEEVFIIGGATLYEIALPLAKRLYLTDIQAEFEGDTFFPKFDVTDWDEIACEQIDNDEKVDFSYRFLTLEKK